MSPLRHAGVFFLLISFICAKGQDSGSSFQFSGYITNMQSVMFRDVDKAWVADNLIHNRINLFWYPADNITATLQMRNRLIYGETLKYTPGYASSIAGDGGLADLSTNLFSGDSYLLNAAIDRLWFQATAGKFVLTAGRQRINWGQNLVWNPNDVFNVYSYFDFDYEERPGSDALRVQFYPKMTTTAELAVKADSSGRVTLAGLYRFNRWNYDIQLLGGVLNGEDIVSGLGFSGNLGGAAFRGELTLFRAADHFRDTSLYVMTALGSDYSFGNSLMVQFEFLYSGLPGDLQGFDEFYSEPLSVKKLAFTKYSLFAAANYPINPLLQGNLAVMVFPGIDGYFAGPSVSYNLKENVDLGLYLQHFSGKIKLPGSLQKTREKLTLAFLRFRWHF